MFRRWLVAFIFTELVEIPIYRRFFGVGTLNAFGASAITHPVVWLVFLYFGRLLGFSYLSRAVSGELFAWLVEAAYFFVLVRPRIRFSRALVGSLLANGVSLGLGILAYELFHWPS
jgi:hypothetical protein